MPLSNSNGHRWMGGSDFCSLSNLDFLHQSSGSIPQLTPHALVILCSWMTTLTALGVPLTVKLTSTPLGNDLCFISYVFHRPIMIGYLIVLAFFDMAVFVAISVRIMSPNPSSSLRSRISCWMFGDKMGHLSRLFLRSSQMYYLWVSGLLQSFLYFAISHLQNH